MLEWTGPSGKPTASRLIPITLFDGDRLHDASLYLTQPIPLALRTGVEYELQSSGQPIGLYDLTTASHNQLGDFDTWLGFGLWKPLPTPAAPVTTPVTVTGLREDEPVLLRKHPKSGTGTPGSTQTASSTKTSAPTASAPGGSGPIDPDRPTLRHIAPQPAASAPTGKASSGTTPSAAPLRETGLNPPDPDRPRLTYGKPKDLPSIAPPLQGHPPAMHRLVAVSDANSTLPHPWAYAWPSPFDQANARRALQSLALAALALQPAPAPPGKPTPLTPPVRLEHITFRSFQLEYSAAPTLVFTASTSATTSATTPATGSQRFVTLIAQPDLYGNPIVLKRVLTDSAHLDETPRLRLIDAVDPTGANRASLLFELLGDHQRRFALYTVLNGSLQQTFTTVPIP